MCTMMGSVAQSLTLSLTWDIILTLLQKVKCSLISFCCMRMALMSHACKYTAAVLPSQMTAILINVIHSCKGP